MTLSRRAVVEAVGTAFLLAAIVGSGIMGETLASGNVAMALLANTIATASALLTLIVTIGPISGAHFNPWVSLVAWWSGGLTARDAGAYIVAQSLGAVAGVVAAHAMFGLSWLTFSTHSRAGLPQGLAEAIATCGLLLVIGLGTRFRPQWVPVTVAAYIASAYWFTSSTSFANPVVTLARALTDTFAGIRPADVPVFLVGQVAGLTAAVLFLRWLLPRTFEECRHG